LTVLIAPADGWYAARVDGAPGVFGQGRTPEEARRDVLSALHDLVYEPTLAERVLFWLRSFRVELRDRLLDR
jgi:predicted RNase H-like HicB family nuclease